VREEAMGPFAKIVFWFVRIIILSAIASMVVWYFFGGLTVAATFEGAPLHGASVKLDGKKVCTTPCVFRPVPGQHHLEVYPPEDYETGEANQSWEMFTFNLGTKLVADFHVPVSQQPNIVIIVNGE
jgi:hypothetical protein